MASYYHLKIELEKWFVNNTCHKSHITSQSRLLEATEQDILFYYYGLYHFNGYFRRWLLWFLPENKVVFMVEVCNFDEKRWKLGICLVKIDNSNLTLYLIFTKCYFLSKNCWKIFWKMKMINQSKFIDRLRRGGELFDWWRGWDCVCIQG